MRSGVAEWVFQLIDHQAISTDAQPIQSNRSSRHGKWKIIGTIAKKLRGLMTGYIIRISDAEDLKKFVQRGYRYHAELSSEDEWVFTRG